MKKDNDLSGQVMIRVGENEAQLDIPRPVISAIHEVAIGNRDSFESFFYDSKVISIDEIKQISEMLLQWSSQYDVQSSILQFIVEHRDKSSGAMSSRNTYSGLDDFLQYDASNTSPAARVIVNFSVVVKVPNSHQLFGYDVTIEFMEAVEWRPDLLPDAESEYWDPFNFQIDKDQPYSLKLRIEYSDYITATTLKSTIESWYRSVESAREKWVVKKYGFTESLLRHSNFQILSPGTLLKKWIPILFSVSLLPAYWTISSEAIVSPASRVILGVILGVSLTAFLETTVSALMHRAAGFVRYYSKLPTLVMNRGNDAIYERLRGEISKQSSRRQTFARVLLLSVVLAFCVSVAANVITNRLFP